MKVCLIINKNRRNSKTIIFLFKKYFKNQSVVNVSKNKSQLLKIYNKKFDYVFSYLCPFKIKNDFLKKTKIHNINFHPGPPIYPGFGCYNFAIFNNDRFYSCTAHLMNSSIDSGKIFQLEKFRIKKNISLNELIKLSNDKLLILFKKVLKKIANNKLEVRKVSDWGKKKYTKKQFNEKFSTLDLKIDKDLFGRYFEASYSKKYGYPIIKINNKKFKFYEN